MKPDLLLERNEYICGICLKRNHENFLKGFIHDLRTPVTVAKLNAELIQSEDNFETIKQMAIRIARSMEQMESLIQSFLNSNAKSELNFLFKPCNLSEIIIELIDDLKGVYGDRFNLSLGNKIIGYWDEVAIRRVLDNLICNAFKYGSEDEPVTIKTEALQNEIHISVHNKGSYLSAIERESVFRPYYRLDSSIKKTGWGIGLPLVKMIVEAHNGRIAVTSSRIEETILKLILPIDSNKDRKTNT